MTCALLNVVIRMYNSKMKLTLHIRKPYGSRTKVIEHKMCGVIFCTELYRTFLFLRLIQRDAVANVYMSSCTVSVILVRF